MSGGPRSVGNTKARRGGHDPAHTRRTLLESRFSVFDGGGSDEGNHRLEDGVTQREQRYHSECYACPIGKAFQGVSQAARSDAFEGLLDALTDLVRSGSKLLETVAARAANGQVARSGESIERIPVE